MKGLVPTSGTPLCLQLTEVIKGTVFISKQAEELFAEMMG